MATKVFSPAALIATLPEAPIYRLSPEQYLAMGDAGILAEDEKVELLEGVIVEKMTQNPPHMVACSLLLRLLTRALPAGWFLAMQGPVATADSLPEPDAVVIRGAERDYLGRRWAASDAGLVVEVSDTTLAFDQGTKKRVYARASCPIYWIVNLVDRRIEVYTEPSGPADRPDYRNRKEFAPGESVPVVLDGALVGHLPVADLLP
jgi:Uma2 family endonuclease